MKKARSGGSASRLTPIVRRGVPRAVEHDLLSVRQHRGEPFQGRRQITRTARAAEEQHLTPPSLEAPARGWITSTLPRATRRTRSQRPARRCAGNNYHC